MFPWTYYFGKHRTVCCTGRVTFLAGVQVCISIFRIHIGYGAHPSSSTLVLYSDNSPPATESVGARAVSYSSICLRGLMSYTNRENFTVLLLPLLELGLNSQYIRTDILLFVLYFYTYIFTTKTFYFENILFEILRLIRLFIEN